ncbi:MAG: alpha/beta hydrolase [Rhodobacteraceae bacterium]|nr:alpha/beta hydrolase [Paracoccaceae bacterium]
MTERATDAALTLFDGDHLRAVLFRPDLPKLVLTFDHRQVGKSDFGAANPLRQAANRGWATLRIMTRRNDWFINSETLALERALATLAQHDRRHAIGYSMGGYAVFRFAASLGLQSAIAVSPQYSVSPEVVPWDTRFHAEAPDFDADLGSLAKHRHKGLKALIVFDPFHRPDLGNASLIAANFPATQLLRLGFSGHPATRALSQHGQSGTINRQLIALQHDPAVFRQAFRETRHLMPDFWQRLAAEASLRHPNLAAVALAKRQRLLHADVVATIPGGS